VYFFYLLLVLLGLVIVVSLFEKIEDYKGQDFEQ
jgi:hypothetical protein